MYKNDIDNKIKTITYILKSAILESETVHLTENCNLEDLIVDAKKHEVVSCVYSALTKSQFASDKLMNTLSIMNQQMIVRDTQQQYYLKKIIDTFEKNCITCILMKGSIIKDLYPNTFFRQSGDIDLYVGAEKDIVKGLMLDLGFKIVDCDNDDSHHDVYYTDPGIYIEIHHRFMRERHSWSAEFDSMVERKVLYKQYKHIYQFTKEDFYVFMIAHMAKHVKFSGIGFKALLDVWIYLNKYEDVLDKKELERVLKKSSLTKFNSEILKLCDYLFEDNEADETTVELSRLFYSNGVYGNQHMIYSEKKYNSGNKNKFLVYIKNFFASSNALQTRYPILRKCRWMLPIIWIIRGIDVVFCRHNSFDSYIDKVSMADVELGKRLNELKRKIGLY